MFDPTLGPDQAAALGVTPMSLDELMRTSRVVSLHAPWLPSTEGMIGAAELAALPDGATFINTARGALVDEAALVHELESGRIDAILDLTWPEPPAPDSPREQSRPAHGRTYGPQRSEFGLLDLRQI